MVPHKLRYAVFVCGIALAVPLLVLTLFALTAPLTAWGRGCLLGAWLFAAGLVAALLRPRLSGALCVTGLVVIAGVTLTHALRASQSSSPLKVIVLPGAHETRWVDLLANEQDALQLGEAALHFIGGASVREHDGLLPAVQIAYKRAGGEFASPVPATYLGLQSPAAFDAVVIEPEGAQPPTRAVLFLHGFMGNVSIQCWEIAQAAQQIDALTVCPSANWVGEWWTPQGAAVVRETMDYLRSRGVTEIYAGGFSNGGNGIGSLALDLARAPELRGLFFIAGIRDAAAIRKTGLPVLVIQGSRDERMTPDYVRASAREVGDHARYVELDADHFLILKQSADVQRALGTWLQERIVGR